MKIYAIEVETDGGRRVIKLPAPIEVAVPPSGEMPPAFRALTEILWGLMREVEMQKPTPPLVEA